LKDTVAKDSTDDELKLFLYVCQRAGLDPFTKQVHLIPRWDSKLGREVRSIQIGIDGLRSIAERTDAYAGNDDPIFEGEEKAGGSKNKKGETIPEVDVPSTAKVVVRKIVQGQLVDFTATARWKQYYPGDSMGFMWRKMPHLMLGKCAEALALRKAFPSVMVGLYIPEESPQTPPPDAKSASPEDKIEKAIGMIKVEMDAKRINDYLKKVRVSKTYTDEQKKKISDVCENRLFEIDNPK
jgi:phage recombination protein Bet